MNAVVVAAVIALHSGQKEEFFNILDLEYQQTTCK